MLYQFTNKPPASLNSYQQSLQFIFHQYYDYYLCLIIDTPRAEIVLFFFGFPSPGYSNPAEDKAESMTQTLIINKCPLGLYKLFHNDHTHTPSYTLVHSCTLSTFFLCHTLSSLLDCVVQHSKSVFEVSFVQFCCCGRCLAQHGLIAFPASHHVHIYTPAR